MFFKCKHNYEVLESIKFDEKISSLSKEQIMWIDYISKQEINKRGVITVCRCKICGDVKHIKTVL